MKAIKYYAEREQGAWAKTGYLFENGIFLCEFEYYRQPKYICRRYDYNNPPEKTTWGQNVVDHNSTSSNPGAFMDYQTFNKKEIIELDFESFKRNILRNNGPGFWSENHPTSGPLE